MKASYSSEVDRLVRDFKEVYGGRNPISRVYLEATSAVRGLRREHRSVFGALEKDLKSYSNRFEKYVGKPSRDYWNMSQKRSEAHWKSQRARAYRHYKEEEKLFKRFASETSGDYLVKHSSAMKNVVELNKKAVESSAKETKKWHDTMFGAFLFSSIHSVAKVADQYLEVTKNYMQEISRLTGKATMNVEKEVGQVFEQTAGRMGRKDTYEALLPISFR